MLEDSQGVHRGFGGLWREEREGSIPGRKTGRESGEKEDWQDDFWEDRGYLGRRLNDDMGCVYVWIVIPQQVYKLFMIGIRCGIDIMSGCLVTGLHC